MAATPNAIEDALSHDRFHRYLQWANYDYNYALDLYLLNIHIAECFYLPLHILEITLRNRINDTMISLYGHDWLYNSNELSPQQVAQRDNAYNFVCRYYHAVTRGRLVASLSFGFWTKFLGRDYERLWRRGLYQIARRSDGRRLARHHIADPADRIRRLRNRMFHHEPVLHWDVTAIYYDTIILTEYMSPEAARWSEKHSNYEKIIGLTHSLLRSSGTI